jgi:hypothetical protein
MNETINDIISTGSDTAEGKVESNAHNGGESRAGDEKSNPSSLNGDEGELCLLEIAMALIRSHLCIPSHWTAKEMVEFVNRNQGLIMAIEYGHVPQKSEVYELIKAFETLAEVKTKENKPMTAAEKRTRKDLKRRLDKLLHDEKMHLQARKDDKYAENVLELSWAITCVRLAVEKSLTVSGVAPNIISSSLSSSSSVSSPYPGVNSGPAKSLISTSHITSDRDAGSTSANSSEETSAQSSKSDTELITIPEPDMAQDPKPFLPFEHSAINSLSRGSTIGREIHGEVELGGKETWEEAAEKLVQGTAKRSRSEIALMEDPRLRWYRVRESSCLRRSWTRKWDDDASE